VKARGGRRGGREDGRGEKSGRGSGRSKHGGNGAHKQQGKAVIVLFGVQCASYLLIIAVRGPAIVPYLRSAHDILA
jgi:hypothetical protein